MSSTNTRTILAMVLQQAQHEGAMSTADIARRAGVDPATVRRVMAGDSARFSTVRLVVQALGLDWPQFLARLATAPVDHVLVA